MKDYENWEGYVQPGKIFGNVYFVGTKPASTHIIDTGDGLIVIDPGYEDKLDLILENMHILGLDVSQIKYIVLSHGHSDHVNATKALVKITRAKTFIGAADATLLLGNHTYDKVVSFQPDVLLNDGDEIVLGNTRILCISTPGHTDGTMSLFFDIKDGDNIYRAGMFGGTGLNTLTKEFLTENNVPFENRDKYFASLDRLENMPVDIFIGNHVSNNDTIGRLERKRNGEENAFLDKDAFKMFIIRMREKLQKMIAEEQ